MSPSPLESKKQILWYPSLLDACAPYSSVDTERCRCTLHQEVTGSLWHWVYFCYCTIFAFIAVEYLAKKPTV